MILILSQTWAKDEKDNLWHSHQQHPVQILIIIPETLTEHQSGFQRKPKMFKNRMMNQRTKTPLRT
jgi:hypothetical protein